MAMEMKDELRAFGVARGLQPSQLWAMAKELMDDDYRATYGSNDEKNADLRARIQMAFDDARRARRPDPKWTATIEGIKHARTLFGFGLREAKDYAERFIADMKLGR